MHWFSKQSLLIIPSMFFNAITELLPGFWGPTAIVFSFILLISYPIFFPGQKGRIRELKGISIISAWQFFNHRHDFMISNFANTTKPHFRFKILQVNIFLIWCHAIKQHASILLLLCGVKVAERNSLITRPLILKKVIKFWWVGYGGLVSIRFVC